MTVDYRSSKFGLGEFLSASLHLLKSLSKPLLKAHLPLFGILVVLVGVFAAGVFLAVQQTGFYNPQKWDSIPMIIQAIGIGVTVIVGTIVSSLVVISVLQVTAASCNGQPLPTSREMVRQAWGRMAAYWGTISILCLAALMVVCPAFVAAIAMKVSGQLGILSAVAVILYLIAMLVIFAGVIYTTFAIEAAALRGCSGMAAIRSSCSLVKGRFWKTFGYMFMLWLVGWAILVLPMMLVQGAITIVMPMAQNMNVIMMVVAGVMGILMALLQYFFFVFTLIGKTVMFLAWEQPKI